MKVKIKIGRNMIDVSDKDIVMDNGSTIEIITKKVFKDWSKRSIEMSKKLFNDLIKSNCLYTTDGLAKLAKKSYTTSVTLYRFNVSQMVANGYEIVE